MATGSNDSEKKKSKPQNYRETLDKTASDRYTTKLESIKLQICPFELKDDVWKDDVKSWPPTEFSHLFAYLLDSPGTYTKEKIKAYRSLEAYNYYDSGYVQTCFYHAVNDDICVLKAKVNPSQRSADHPHLAWVALCRQDGDILTAHCQCMAGLGETCSHVAAILFKIQAAHQLGYSSKAACTSEPCKWNQCFNKKVEPAAVIEIDFKRPKQIGTKSLKNGTREVKKLDTGKFKPDQSELDSFFKSLKDTGNRIAILATVPEFCSDYKQEPEINPNLPPPLTSVTPKDNQSLDDAYRDYTVTAEECIFLEESTVKQSNCRLWSEHRIGRITASNLHSVLHTNQEKPSKSVMQAIFMESKNSKSQATEWGTSKENVARNSYTDYQSTVHKNFTCKQSGLVINPKMPFMAASPDGWISCACCGDGLLEIKCPFKYREVNPADLKNATKDDKTFCLHYSGESVTLKANHRYYFQVQAQLLLTDMNFCDFVVWTKKGFDVVRVPKATDFGDQVLPKSEQFFLSHCLPRLCGKPKNLHSRSFHPKTTCCLCIFRSGESLRYNVEVRDFKRHF